jgi:hypothetical protein
MSYQYHLARAYQDQLLQDVRDAQSKDAAAPRQRWQIPALLSDILHAVARGVAALRRPPSASDLDVEPAC